MLGGSCDNVSRPQRPEGGLSAPTAGLPRNPDPSALPAGDCGRSLHGPCSRWLAHARPLGVTPGGRKAGSAPHVHLQALFAIRARRCRGGGAFPEEMVSGHVPAALVPGGEESGARRLALTACLFLSPTATSPCKILKCNSEFWSATAGSHSPASDDAPEFCAALRTYALCTRRTARTCRGDLAYHSAVHGIEDLMSQYNCSKDGPTSQPRLRTLPPPGDSQERSDSPEVCHYEKSFHKHSAAPNYTHCGLFGDPHLRTFTDRFQTCKVQGAWPLIDNNYLNVQVTNTPVLPGSAATATSKVRAARLSPAPRPRHRLQPLPLRVLISSQ